MYIYVPIRVHKRNYAFIFEKIGVIYDIIVEYKKKMLFYIHFTFVVFIFYKNILSFIR